MRFLQPHCCFSPAAITAPRTGGWSKTRRPWRPTSPVTAHDWARRRPRCRPSGCGAGSSKPLRAADAEQIRRLGIRLRRLDAAAKAVAVTDAEIRTPLRDTVVVRIHDTLPVRDTVRMFRWRDPWISVEGRIGRDSAACRIRSVDTLRQAVHRIPRRFLFIRWGTKALRQEIVSTNPHTRIVYAEYVKIER